MNLLGRFEKYVQETLLLAKSDKILLAVSGGRDSMLMTHLFLQAGYDCVLAHCNFGLRGAASDLDEALVREFAEKHALPFFVEHFSTEAYAAAEGISIQMAARDLRYAWFAELREQENAQWIAVAQHQNDHIETALLNLTRGTGLQGLRGILPKRGRIIRPLLFFSSDEVTQAVQTASVPFRDDASNFSAKYARNKLRLEIIPKFREISPDFDRIMLENIAHFQESYALLATFIAPLQTALFERVEDKIAVRKAKLDAYIGNLALLFELFKPCHFPKPILADLQSAWHGDSGKRFQSPTHELLLDREWLWIRPIHTATQSAQEQLLLSAAENVQFANRIFTMDVTDEQRIIREQNCAQIDYDRLMFPLKLRYWNEGDVFHPLGMNGRKKLSDFFIQQKVGLYDKKNIPILINGNGEIIWVVGYRLDNRYRITESTKKVFTLVCK